MAALAHGGRGAAAPATGLLASMWAGLTTPLVLATVAGLLAGRGIAAPLPRAVEEGTRLLASGTGCLGFLTLGFAAARLCTAAAPPRAGDSPADTPALLLVKVFVLPRVYAAVASALGCAAPPGLFQLLGVLPASPSVHALAMARGVAPGTFAGLVPASLLCTAAALLGPDELYTAAGTATVLWLVWEAR